jgi:hypothetical protein
MVYEGLDAGDETRRNGDYIGFPHPDGDGTALDSVSVPVGVPVTYDGTNIAEATASASDIVGVTYAYDVYGDTGQEKISDNDVTVKTSGSVLADLSGIGVTAGDGGTVHGNNGELLIVEVVDADNDIAEVLIR